MLTAKSLSCERGERLLFDNLNFTVRPGEILQVTGANGAGKSSLLKIIAGLIQPQAGTVLWQQQPIADNKAIYLANMHYLGHLDGIKLGLTVLENVNFAGCLMAKMAIDSHTAIQHVGLADFSQSLASTLSAGQKRRIALAQLIVSGAKLWILDEPFTALDQQTTVIVEQLIESHRQNGGMAIIATHQSTQTATHFLQMTGTARSMTATDKLSIEEIQRAG